MPGPPRTDGLRSVRPRAMVTILAVAVCVVAACDTPSTETGGPTGERATITVSAASSLREAFATLGQDFEGVAEVDVTFNFDSSSSLATQIIEGAPADVFASAAPEDMARARQAGVAGSSEIFARNDLTIVTAAGNPGGIASLSDLVGAGVISLCDENVPCGRYAQRALDAAEVTIPDSSITRGQNASATLTAVAEGDAVAGVVYASDAVAAGARVEAVPIATGGDLTASYVIGVLEGTAHTEAARDFVALVLSDQGQAVLQDHGFLSAR